MRRQTGRYRRYRTVVREGSEESLVFRVHVKSTLRLDKTKDEVKRFGSLDNISCFPFENYLGQLKRKYSMTSYAIVIFTGQGEVALVPEVWCIGTDLCYWPPYKTMLRFEKAVHSCQPPSEQWSKHKIRILSTTDSYEKACRLVRKAEDTSDIQTDANDNPANPPCRKRKRRSRYISDSDESDDTVPNEFAEPSSPPPCPSPSLLSLPLLPIVPPALPPTSDTRSVSLPLPSHTPSGTTISSPDNDRVPSTVAGSTLPPAISYSVARRWPVNSTPSRTTISRPSNSSNIDAVQSTSNLSPVGHMSTSGTNVSVAERSIIRLLIELKAEMKELKTKVNHILQSHQTEQQDAESIAEDLSLPLTTREELQCLEERLKTDKSVQKQLLCILSTVGGRNLREVIKRMLHELMSNDVAINLNWTGQGEKMAFKELALRPILEKAVRRNNSTLTCTGCEIKREICHYLKGAPDRDGGRQARRNLNHAEQ
ncbi:uncharacterized protein [Apostichopus japonicus]|uniref:uncharacterized protein isoform X2 n=1 Tax=Stichopus japonicus TaxID=307972 RepID=UPI003AB84EDF